jgi:Cytochrome oxidase maturation protein cbb3-type
MGDYTVVSTVPMYAFMGLMVAGALIALGLAIRSGAVRDDESPKYRMLEDDEPQAATKNDGRKA